MVFLSNLRRTPSLCSPSRSLLVLMLAATAMEAAADPKIFSIKDYGAVADGRSDNSKAILSAWNGACAWQEGSAQVLIPQGSYLTGPITLKGPCKRPMVLNVQGVILASTDLNVYPTSEWILFMYLREFTITGHGKFHGQGATTWPKNDCRKNTKCSFPNTIKFAFLNDSVVEDISSVDSKMFHFTIYSCRNIVMQRITISAPESSINTDGIHIGISTNITITDSVIGTGDDCVSIGPGNEGVHVSKVFCGPGHGISVGSMGRYENDRDVTNLSVINCTFTGTTNGVRIKSWQDSYVLTASNFTFEDLVMNNVSNPIIIDQEYCPSGGCAGKAPSRVKISNVKFRNIRGTSNSNVAVNLKCSKSVPCEGVELNNINLTYIGVLRNVVASAACSNVIGTSVGTIVPPPCL